MYEFVSKDITDLLFEAHMIELDLDIGETIKGLGKILGGGTYSVAIKLKRTVKDFKNPVLVITLEEQKEELFKKITGLKTSHKVNKKEKDFIKKLDSEDIFFFITEEMKKVPIERENLAIEYLQGIFSHNWITQKTILKKIKKIQTKGFSKKDKKLINAVKKSLKKAASLVDTIVCVDIHEQQFLEKKGKIFFTDPFVF